MLQFDGTEFVPVPLAVPSSISDLSDATDTVGIDLTTASTSPVLDITGSASSSLSSTISTGIGGNTVRGHAQIVVNGTKRWIAFFDDPTTFPPE